MPRRGKPPSSTTQDRRGIQSVEVSAVILSALAQAPGAVSLKDLSQAADMPPSKIHRYLSSFIRAGFVRQNEATGQYDLGPASLRLGLSALSRFDVIDEASAVMKSLSDDLNLTSLLCIWGPNGPTIVRWQRAQEALLTSLNLGSILPLLRSATGHVFLSYLPISLTQPLVKAEAAKLKREGQTPNTKKQIDAVTAGVRDHGFAQVDSSVIPGLRALAAPIIDHQGDACAAITLIGTDARLLSKDEPIVEHLLDATRRLSMAPHQS